MTFNNLDSFSQLLRERSYDDLEKQKLGKAISPRDKWNLKMDISSLKKELTDLQNTAAELPDDYVEEICRSENYPLEDSIDNDMELNQWCDETEDLLDDSLGLNESLFGGSPEKRLLRQMQRLQKKIDSCDDLAEKLELNKQILDLANKRSSLFYNSMNMPLTEDYKYKAKIGDSYLKGNGFTTKASEADTFESETEPRQRINQMRKDRKHTPKGNVSVEKIKENEQRITYSKLENLLKRAYRSKAKVSDDPIHEEVTCTIYCGAGFNVGVTATSYEDLEDAGKVCFYVSQQFEDEIGEMNMGEDLKQTIKDLFQMASDISEMEERPYIDDAEIRKLEDIADGQSLLFENEKINNRRIL